MFATITKLEKKEPKTDRDISKIKSDITKLEDEVAKIKKIKGS